MDEPVQEADGALSELRHLIIGPEQESIAALRHRVEDRAQRVRDVGDVLPEAAALRADDVSLSRALAPAVEDALIASVRANPNTLADVLFPVMGPAIRKSLAQFIATMLEGMNRTLEQSFSVQGLLWRWEALRTGQSFAQVVLLHTLVYRTEQIFLIHRTTGLPLLHVAAPEARDAVQDADMVSGMLTAIRDFVQDAFKSHTSTQSLDALRVGELEVWVEQGPHAVLAAVIRGTAPKELHTELQEVLEQLHLRFGRLLETFAGDASPFAAAQPELESCLRSGYRREPQKRRLSPALAAILVLLAGLGIWLTVVGVIEARRWNAYVAQLRQEPGLLVVAERSRWRSHVIAGLRDPLARDPIALMAGSGLEPARVESRWEPYHAAEPAFVLARAHQVLDPPAGVQLSFAEGTLSARGSGDAAWINQARVVSRLIPGVVRFEHDPALESVLARVQPVIERCRLYFALGGAEPLSDPRCDWPGVLGALRELAAAAARAGRRVMLSVAGYADATGRPEGNAALSQARANAIRQAILATGIQGLAVQAVGHGARSPAAGQSLADDRHVVLTVTLGDTGAPSSVSTRP
jgi:OOP family OmpA-OmpF porin